MYFRKLAISSTCQLVSLFWNASFVIRSGLIPSVSRTRHLRNFRTIQLDIQNCFPWLIEVFLGQKRPEGFRGFLQTNRDSRGENGTGQARNKGKGSLGKGSLGTGQRFHYQLYTFNLKYNTRSRKHRYLSNSADKGTKHALSNLACPQGSVRHFEQAVRHNSFSPDQSSQNSGIARQH